MSMGKKDGKGRKFKSCINSKTDRHVKPCVNFFNKKKCIKHHWVNLTLNLLNMAGPYPTPQEPGAYPPSPHSAQDSIQTHSHSKYTS